MAPASKRPLVAWIFAGADHLMRNARFKPSLPAFTVPPVEAVLADPERTIAWRRVSSSFSGRR
jgi:hypothetical protein